MSLTYDIPQFFIVGAPKSGTTALYNYLQQHPQIHLAPKEIHFFGSDLGIIQKPLSKQQYLNLFNPHKTNGDASVWYLYSSKAAKEISDWNSNAKIIILLRSPYTMLPSLYLEHIKNGDENNKDFNIALKKNLSVKTSNFFHRPGYLETVNYYEQIRRYYACFGEKNILLLLYEDWLNNNQIILNKICEFLNVSSFNFTPIQNVNTKKQVKNITLQGILKQKPSLLKWTFRTVVPRKMIRHRIMKSMLRWNEKNNIELELTKTTQSLVFEVTQEQAEKIQQFTGINCSIWLP